MFTATSLSQALCNVCRRLKCTITCLHFSAVFFIQRQLHPSAFLTAERHNRMNMDMISMDCTHTGFVAECSCRAGDACGRACNDSVNISAPIFPPEPFLTYKMAKYSEIATVVYVNPQGKTVLQFLVCAGELTWCCRVAPWFAPVETYTRTAGPTNKLSWRSTMHLKTWQW